MTILSTSGVLVVLAVVMLLWFIPRNMRRASAADTPEQTVVNPHSMTDDVLTSHSILFSEESAVPGSDPKKSNTVSRSVKKRRAPRSPICAKPRRSSLLPALCPF